MARVTIEELRSLVLGCIRDMFPESDAERIADVIVFGEMAGRASHGVLRLLPGSYGVMDEDPGPSPVVERLGSSAAKVTGRQGMVVASMATDLVAELAAESGFAVVVTRGSRSTSGSLAYFVEKLASQGLFCFISAGTPDFVGIPGSSGRALGTNPIAFGIPTDGRPFVLDMATAAISGGDVLTAVAEGTRLVEGVAVDADGAETVDPSDVLDGGAVLPFGGHKGLGLALMVEILNKALTGAQGDPGDWGHVFVAFSVSMLGDESEIRRRASAEVRRLETAGARIPGGRTLANRDESAARGWVEIEDAALERLRGLAG